MVDGGFGKAVCFRWDSQSIWVMISRPTMGPLSSVVAIELAEHELMPAPPLAVNVCGHRIDGEDEEAGATLMDDDDDEPPEE